MISFLILETQELFMHQLGILEEPHIVLKVEEMDLTYGSLLMKEIHGKTYQITMDYQKEYGAK